MTILGRLSKAGERDEFTIKAPPGSKHEVRVEAWGLGSALDGQLRVFDKDGRLLGETDDGKGRPRRRAGGGGGRAAGPVSTDPAFDLTMPPGQDEVKVVVKDLMDRGGVGFTYRLVVEPVETAFQLALDDDQVAIPRGGTALIPVNDHARRIQRADRSRCPRRSPAERGVTVDPWHRARRSDPRRGRPQGRCRPADSTRATSRSWARETMARPSRRSRTIVFAQQTISTPGFGMTGTIPSYCAAVRQPHRGGDPARPDRPESRRASKLVVPQGGTVEVPLQVVRDDAGDDEVPARRAVASDRPERDRVGDRRERHERHGEGHGGGGRTARPAHARPARPTPAGARRSCRAILCRPRSGHRRRP